MISFFFIKRMNSNNNFTLICTYVHSYHHEVFLNLKTKILRTCYYKKWYNILGYQNIELIFLFLKLLKQVLWEEAQACVLGCFNSIRHESSIQLILLKDRVHLKDSSRSSFDFGNFRLWWGKLWHIINLLVGWPSSFLEYN